MPAPGRDVLMASGGRLLAHACPNCAESPDLGEACPNLDECLKLLHPWSPCTLLRFQLLADGGSSLAFASGGFQNVHDLPFDEVRDDTLPLFAMLHPQDFDRVMVSMTQATRTLTPWVQEYRILTRQGGLRWLRTCLVPYPDGPTSVVGYGLLSDVTLERKLRCDLLQLCDQGAVGVFRTTFEGHFLSVNERFAQIFGYSSAEDFLRYVSDITQLYNFHPEEYATVLKLLESHGSIQRYSMELLAKGGETVWVSLNVRALRNTAGRIEYCEGYCADISEQMRAELRAGWCPELTQASFGPQGTPARQNAQKPTGAHPGGLCHVLAHVQSALLWRVRLPRVV